MYVVVTADQRGSRRSPDRVPDALHLLADVEVHRPFERTAGDELQGLLDGAPAVVASVEALVRAGSWSIGVGIGAVEQPLPDSTRAGRGEAFVRARKAVESAKSAPARIAVVGDDPGPTYRWETVLVLWASLLHRRTAGGWEVADLLGAGLTHEAAAARLGITQSAVSQRAAAAGFQESVRGRTLATDLLTELMEDA